MTNIPTNKLQPVPKELKNSIILIQDLEKKASITSIIKRGSSEPINAIWQKGIRQYNLVIDDPSRLYADESNHKDSFSLKLEKHLVKFKQLFVSSWSGNKAMGAISAMQSDNFTHTSPNINRVFIPLPLEMKPDFTFAISAFPVIFSIGNNITCTYGIKVNLARKSFLMYVATDHTSKPTFKYLILECEQKLSEKFFHEYCYSILLSFGFITGELILNEGYFIQYDQKDMIHPVHFAYTRLRSSISCSYVPVYTNPYGWLHDAKLHNLYKNKVRLISSNEFAELCRLVHTENDYKGVLLLILETASVSLVSSPANLAVALESLAGLMEKENEKAFSVIDKSIFKRMRKDLVVTMLKYQGEIGVSGAKYLTNKLNSLNQVTNRDKLLIPFKILGITLNEKDVFAIEQRNAFLHGTHPLIETPKGRLRDKSDGLRYFLFLKLYTLISAILLKKIGYDNLIVNYPKIYEKETKIKLNEDQYRQI